MGTTDAVWLRYAVNDPDLGAPDRDAVIRYMQGAQAPSTGMVAHAWWDGHCTGHAFWQTVRALKILGTDLAHFPAHLSPMCSSAGLDAWFAGFDWNSSAGSRPGNHHEVLGLVPVVVSLRDNELTETFFRNLAKQQDPRMGTWPHGRTGISRTFAYTALHLSADRLPAMPEKIVDEFLRLQEDSGLWERDLPGFGTMDCAYVLVRLPKRIGYREAAAAAALGRLSVAMRSVYAAQQARILCRTHHALAVTHTFGLLQEAFPDEYPSQRPYRFDWDRTSLYDSQTIRDGIGG
jgi:hypothetical protein